MPKIDGFSIYQNQYQQTGQNVHSAEAEGARGVRQDMQQLPRGTVFEGTITDSKDGFVQMSLSNGQSIRAQLEPGVQVRMGEPVLFEVKSNQEGKIMLRQVPVKSVYNPTLQRALSAAGMPVNQRNLDMVDMMMQNQMPINRESLNAMLRQLLRYPQASPQTLIQMQKLGFAINKESVMQFEAYKAGEHTLVDKFSQIMEQLPDLAGEGADAERILNLQNQLLDILEIESGLPKEAGKSEGIWTEGGNVPPGAGTDQSTSGLGGGSLPGADGMLSEESVIQKGDALLGTEGTMKQESAVLEGGGPKPESGIPGMEGELPESAQAAAGKDPLESGGPPKEGTFLKPQTLPGGDAAPQQPVAPGTLGELFSRTELQGLERQLKQIPGMETEGRIFTDGELNPNVSAKELLSLIRENLSQAGSKDASLWKELFQGKEYKSLLKQVMSEQWLLEPEQVAQKENVEQLYQRVNRQMAKLEQFLQDAGKDAPTVNRQVNQVRGNLEMMNQINQLYNYVQIPLKLHGQNAHSDLYVYTNKKKLQDRDGELSALLHLELDHLGTTDVQVKMLGRQVTANFYLSDDTAYKLVEQHIEDLRERLEQKGYHCGVQLELQVREMDFVEDFLEREAPVGQLSRYSFDVLT